ncbi:MAG: hypothetical protein ACK50J_24550 [Planctomyces sp.]
MGTRSVTVFDVCGVPVNPYAVDSVAAPSTDVFKNFIRQPTGVVVATP